MIEVPCGKCIQCRIARAREWAVRIVHESGRHSEKCFITLTYSDENLPQNGSLSKRDLQLFLKRLRKELGDKRIKYYASGEYGDNTLRPHYHLIIFGFKPDDLKFAAAKKGKPIWSSDLLLKLWPNGHNSVGSVSYDSARYTAEYCMKKVYRKEGAEEFYKGVEPPFALMSKGIGKEWALKYRDQIVANTGFTLKGRNVGVPRYYKKVLNLTEEENFIKQAEEREREERMKAMKMELDPHFNVKVNHGLSKERAQRETNVRARLNRKRKTF
jgi:hypothetical protein